MNQRYICTATEMSTCFQKNTILSSIYRLLYIHYNIYLNIVAFLQRVQVGFFGENK